MNKLRACIPLALLCLSVAACKSPTPEAPQILTVGCSTDDLITAIDQATAVSGPAEINLAADCTYQFTSWHDLRTIDGVTIGSALPPITDEIKLVGNNATLSADIQGIMRFGFFLVQPEGYLKTDKLIMKGGRRALGGAVFIDRGRAYFDETTFFANTAEGSQSATTAAAGGAIYNRQGSLTVLGDSVVEANVAETNFLEPDLDNAGGGIFSSNAFLMVMRTSVKNNRADYGGGIAIRREASGLGQEGTFISGSEFLGNRSSAIFALGERTDFYISGVDFTVNASSHAGGGLELWDSILDLSGSNFNSNIAANCGAVDSYYNSELLISSTNFYGNMATGSGGALCSAGESLKIRTSRFSSNRADELGGAVYAPRWFSATDTVFEANMAGEYGGGIYVGDSVDILRSTFSENTAFWGGGLYAGPTDLSDPTSSGSQAVVNVRQSMFSGNHAIRPAGGQSASVGGGIAFVGLEMKIEQSTFWANQSADAGGGLYIRRGFVEVVNSTISNNLSADGAAAFMTKNSQTSFLHVTMFNNVPSAGVVLSYDAPVTIKNSAIVSDADISNCNLPWGPDYLTAEGENLESHGSCDGFSVINAYPVFLDIADNGGPTLTNMLAPGSPAFNAAADCGGLTEDQRGVHRPQYSTCDLGAVEFIDLGITAPMPPDNTQTDSPGRCEYRAIENASCRAGDDARTQLIKVLTQGDMLELLSLNPELTHGLFALPDGRSCWVWMPFMEGPADPIKNCNVPINNPPDYVPEGPACSADLPKDQCEAAGGKMSGPSSPASECICPSAASLTDSSIGPQSMACAGTGDRGIDPSAGPASLAVKFSILWPK